MKKILFVLLAMLAIFTLTACGDKKEETSNNKDKTSEKETKKDDNKKEKKKEEDNKKEEENNKKDNDIDDIVIDDDEIIELDDKDNNPYKDEDVRVDEVINCPGCVYGYFDKEGDSALKLGDTLSPGEYFNDITKIRTSGNKQRHNFFGFVLSDNKIVQAYTCIYKDHKIYCLHGDVNGAYQSSNIGILNMIFGADKCKTISDGHNYTCTDGSYNGNTKDSGYTSLHYETSCTFYGSDVSYAGRLVCH